jgi:phage terminase large subunit-like protein
MNNETPQTDSSVDDRVTSFAHSVLSGEIVAGPNVRNACKRHLRDVEQGAARGLIWDVESAIRAIAFFEEVLCLNGGDYEGMPFLLAPWQAFVVGSLFGWMTIDGFRRFRLGYIETGKGSGKSPLVAGIGLSGIRQ